MMYDVIIIGAGPAGLFSSLYLARNSNLKVLLIDEGKFSEKRVCPMNYKGISCINCNPCNILSGYGGAGTFSDGKLNFIPKLGKTDLFKYMEKEINSTKREVIFLETTLRRIKEKKLPEMQNELETLLSNRESQAKIKQQRKLINECTDNYNKTIKNYHEINEYLNILKKDALKIAKVLKCNLN